MPDGPGDPISLRVQPSGIATEPPGRRAAGVPPCGCARLSHCERVSSGGLLRLYYGKTSHRGDDLKREHGQDPRAYAAAPGGGGPPSAETPVEEVRRLRDALSSARAALRDRVAEEARPQLASGLAALGSLVAGVSHEVNNPLAGIVVCQGVALEALRDLRGEILGGGGNPQAQARAIDAIADALRDAQEGAQRIARVVRDLAVFGRSDPARVPVRLEDEARAAVAWLQPAGAVDVRIEVEPVPPVLAVPGQVLHVIVNLLDNAIRAIPVGRAGHVVVRIGPGRPGMARVEVEDDGVGMAPWTLGRAFEPFFTTRAAGEGRGLGLALCQAVVAGHGGSIVAESAEGKGSIFRVELPLAEAGRGGGGRPGDSRA